MASVRFANRPVQLRHDDSDTEGGDGEDIISDDGLPSASESNEGTEQESSGSEPETSSVTSEDQSDAEPSLQDISFGALAKAQESLGPRPRKRKLADTGDVPDRADSVQKQDTPNTASGKDHFPKRARHDVQSRSSKHAPTIQSSRYAVSRKRDIFESSAVPKSRDPRFDPTVTASVSHHDKNAAERANKNYSFLTSYQANEILDLKSQIKKAKDPILVANLKRQVMSIESKLRSAEAKRRETEIRRKHQEQEKEAIKRGQKARPYYLKDSEVKKQANTERLEGMGKRARDKAVERKRKREKGKEARNMPRVRRNG